jgi:hypothetical protein
LLTKANFNAQKSPNSAHNGADKQLEAQCDLSVKLSAKLNSADVVSKNKHTVVKIKCQALLEKN